MKFVSKKESNDFFEFTDMTDDGITLGDENAIKNFASHAITAEEINRQPIEKSEQNLPKSPLDALKNKMLHHDEEEEKPIEEETTAEEKDSLFDKCLPYVTDENGEIAKDETNAYSLDNFSEGASASELLSMLYKKYNIKFENVTDNTPEVKEEIKEEPESEKFSVKIPELKDIQTNIPVISDIDSGTTVADTPDTLSQTGTIRFTPIRDNDSEKDIMSVSSVTRPIDLTGELTQLPDNESTQKEELIKISKNEFEEYTPKEEFVSSGISRPLIIKLAKKRRNSFLRLSGTIILSLLLLIFKLTTISQLMTADMIAFTVASLLLLGSIILINLDMFISLPKIFSKRANADSLCSVTSVVTLVYSIISLSSKISPIDTMLLCALILCFRAWGAFMKNAYIISNLRQINTNIRKRAITLIDDPAVTFAMAKNAIEGDVLIAAPKYADNIEDYMKYTTYGSFMNAKLPSIAIVSFITSIIIGLVCGAYFDSIVNGFYAAASILCFAGMPIIYLIENMPLFAASKKLNRRGAMIAGKAGADIVEMANAIVLSSEDLFPSGTLTLHDIKVLSENNIDDTLLRAASLTDAIGSPLTNIFKKIVKPDSSIIPVSDTIKYEDRMGISGWVDDELLFIGNRTLLEAHGISVPSIETDRKILKNGYFPIYVASQSTVYALLIVQYSVNPEVAHELRKLTALGVTILVNNTDPNLTEEMICDYLGLYSDSVKVMSAAGTHLYKSAVRPINSVSAPAAYKGNPLALASIINCASRIKKSNTLLTVIYVLAAVIGAVLFIYAPFSAGASMLSGSFVLLYNLVSSIIAYLLYLTLKP